MARKLSKKERKKRAFIKGDTVTLDINAIRMDSAGKENKSMGYISTGTGAHKNKKAYNRRAKHTVKY